MRPDTKLKLARRKQTLELLKWLYARSTGAKISREHRHSLKDDRSRSLTYGEVISIFDDVYVRTRHAVPDPLQQMMTSRDFLSRAECSCVPDIFSKSWAHVQQYTRAVIVTSQGQGNRPRVDQRRASLFMYKFVKLPVCVSFVKHWKQSFVAFLFATSKQPASVIALVPSHRAHPRSTLLENL